MSIRPLPFVVLLVLCTSLAAQITEYQKVVIEAKKQVRRDQGLVVSMSPEVILAIRGKPFTATCVYSPHKEMQAGKMVESGPLRAKIARDNVGRIYREEIVVFSDDQGYIAFPTVRIYDPIKQVQYALHPGEQEVVFHQYPMKMLERPVPNKDGSPLTPPPIVYRGKPSVDLDVEQIEGFTAYGETLELPVFVRGRIKRTSSGPELEEMNEWFSPELAMVMKIVTKRKGITDHMMEVTDVSVGEPDPALFELPPGSTIREDSASPAGEKTVPPR